MVFSFTIRALGRRRFYVHGRAFDLRSTYIILYIYIIITMINLFFSNICANKDDANINNIIIKKNWVVNFLISENAYFFFIAFTSRFVYTRKVVYAATKKSACHKLRKSLNAFFKILLLPCVDDRLDAPRREERCGRFCFFEFSRRRKT